MIKIIKKNAGLFAVTSLVLAVAIVVAVDLSRPSARSQIVDYVSKNKGWPANSYMIEKLRDEKGIEVYEVYPLRGSSAASPANQPPGFFVLFDPAKGKIKAVLRSQ